MKIGSKFILLFVHMTNLCEMSETKKKCFIVMGIMVAFMLSIPLWIPYNVDCIGIGLLCGIPTGVMLFCGWLLDKELNEKREAREREERERQRLEQQEHERLERERKAREQEIRDRALLDVYRYYHNLYSCDNQD